MGDSPAVKRAALIAQMQSHTRISGPTRYLLTEELIASQGIDNQDQMPQCARCDEHVIVGEAGLVHGFFCHLCSLIVSLRTKVLPPVA